MDELEQRVLEYDRRVRDRALAEKAIAGASQAWEDLVGTDPAYVEVLATNSGISKNRVVVEIDGVRISAYDSTCLGIYTHYWRICESPLRKWSTAVALPDLDLVNLRKHLSTRRKRLKRRGLYNG